MLEGVRTAVHDSHFPGRSAASKSGVRRHGLARWLCMTVHLERCICLIYVLREHHRHDETDLRQGVLHAHGVDDILQRWTTTFARAVIEDIETVGTSTIIGVVTPGANGYPATAIVESELLGHGIQCPADHICRKAHAETVCFGPTSHQQLPCSPCERHADTFQDLQVAM